MAKPRLFLSSTFYDLKQIRADIDQFIENMGYEAIRNEEGDIPYGKEEALEEYCYKEISNVDILISIVGGRFGSESIKKEYSISQIELKTALKSGKQVYIFIDKNIFAEYETYLLNKDKEVNYRYVDDVRIYKFIEEVKALPNNNNIKNFETASDITKYLKEQFAGLFQRFLQEQERLKEINLIKNIESTARTLNQLVNYLSEENKDKTDEINRILFINHPAVLEIKEILSIPYNFYIEGFKDLIELLNARSYKYCKDLEDENSDYYLFTKNSTKKISTLMIAKCIFENDKLKFIKKSDWDETYIYFEEEDVRKNEEDLPF